MQSAGQTDGPEPNSGVDSDADSGRGSGVNSGVNAGADSGAKAEVNAEVNPRTGLPSPAALPTPGVMRRYFSAVWWQHVVAFSWLFRRHLRAAALFFLLFGLALTPVLDTMEGWRHLNGEPLDGAGFIRSCFLMVISLCIGGASFIAGMLMGVLKLTAFTRAFLSCPLPVSASEINSDAYKESVRTYQSEGINAMSHHKAYLAQAWLLAFVVALPLLICVFICSIFVVILHAPAVPEIPIPAEMRGLAIYFQIAMIAATVMINNYSIVTLAETSMANLTVGQATKKSLLLSLTTAPLLTLVSVIAVVLCTAITTPHEVANMIHPRESLIPGPLPVAMAWEVWQVLSSVMVFPICTALLSEVVRDSIWKDMPSAKMPPAPTEGHALPPPAAVSDASSGAAIAPSELEGGQTDVR